MSPHRIFLLSPADCSGTRARMVMRPGAAFDLARRLRARDGAPLGEIFSFMSGLYFRGKLAYARAFAAPPPGLPGVLVITTNEGLVQADEPVTLARLRSYATGDIDAENAAYRRPLLRDARRMARGATDGCEIVLLGSVASGKYVDVLEEACGARLRFPLEFVGRGDMSRGGLMLRCAAARRELTYVPLAGTARRGPRPPRLGPASRAPALVVVPAAGSPPEATGEARRPAASRPPIPGASARGTRRSPPRREPTPRS